MSLQTETKLWTAEELWASGLEMYRLDGSVDTVGPEGSLSGEQVVPGFSWPLRELGPR